MCTELKLIKQTQNGKISKCTKCNSYHLTFGQFYVSFTKQELSNFTYYINSIDANYWINMRNDYLKDRKIPIRTEQNNLHLLLNKTEFLELCNLIDLKSQPKEYTCISSSDIEYHLLKN